MSTTPTEPASPRVLARARARGDLPYASELPLALALLVFGGLASALLPTFGRSFRRLSSAAWGGSLATEQVWPLLRDLAGSLMLALLAGAAAALAAIVAQRAPTLRWFADSSERAGRGPHNPARSVRVTLLKLGVLLVGLGAKVADSWPGLLSAYQLDAAALLAASARLIEALLFRAAAVLLALGAIELGVQQLARLRRLRMTRAEVKEEQRELLGDPQMLAERRARAARSMERLSPQLRAAAISQLSAAALLLTGDNRVVALRYAPGQDEVPIVWLKADGAHAIELVQRAYSLDLELATEPQLVDELSRLALLAPIPTAWHERVAQLLVRAKGAAS